MAVIEPATYDPVTSGAYRKNPDGSVSTVKTATSEVDGNYMNYPTIQKSPSGNWVELPPAVALSNVLKSGQHLGVYDDEQEALDAAEQLHQSEAARLGLNAGLNAAMRNDNRLPALTDEQAVELARLEALFGSTPYNGEKAVGKEPPAGWNAEHAPEFNRRFDELIKLVDSQK